MIEDQSKCLLGLHIRQKGIGKYLGACAIEYESMIQIVIKILIGWD